MSEKKRKENLFWNFFDFLLLPLIGGILFYSFGYAYKQPLLYFIGFLWVSFSLLVNWFTRVGRR